MKNTKVFGIILYFFLFSTSLYAAIYQIPEALKAEIIQNKKILEQNPNSAEAHFELAMSYAYSGKIEKGWNILKKVPELDPKYQDEVVAKYSQLSQAYPEEWTHRFKLAFGYYFQEKKALALEQFELILKDYPEHVWAMGFKALLLGEQQRYQEVIDLCKKALHLESNATAIHFLLGEAYMKTGNYIGVLTQGWAVMRLQAEEARYEKEL